MVLSVDWCLFGIWLFCGLSLFWVVWLLLVFVRSVVGGLGITNLAWVLLFVVIGVVCDFVILVSFN